MRPAAAAPERTGPETGSDAWPHRKHGATCRLRVSADSHPPTAGARLRTGLARANGFTLVEVVMVVAILVVLAAVLLPRLDDVLDGTDTQPGARHKITRLSLHELRAAIKGTPSHPGFEMDLGEIPALIQDLLVMPMVPLPSGKPVNPYSALSQMGWNGPYLQQATGKYIVDDTIGGSGFTSAYGTSNAPALLDAWGHTLILQWPTTAGLSLADRQRFTRLVSAGPDGKVNTPSGQQSPDPDDTGVVGDDVVVYLSWMGGW